MPPFLPQLVHVVALGSLFCMTATIIMLYRLPSSFFGSLVPSQLFKRYSICFTAVGACAGHDQVATLDASSPKAVGSDLTMPFSTLLLGSPPTPRLV